MMTMLYSLSQKTLLERSFLDLRFGMFLHCNMATFQDREWGDPTTFSSGHPQEKPQE